MKTLRFASNQERDEYLQREYRDRRETVTPYVFDVPGGTMSVYEKTLVIEPPEGQRAPSSTGEGGSSRAAEGQIPPSAASPPADPRSGAFGRLAEDHDRMLSIAMKIRARLASRDHEAVRDLFQALKTEIEVHSKIEDLHVYRIFQQAEATRDAAARALEAHRAIQASLDALGGGPSESDWPMRFEKVYKSLEQHARDEEQHLFGRAGEILTREEAHELDLTIETARRQITGQEPPPAGGIPAG